MALVSWRNDYRVGVAVVDAEHRFLFSLINAFHDAYASGQCARDLSIVLTRLVAYAEQHFQHEEALMQREHYPRLAHHKLQHEKLYATIYELNEKLAAELVSVDRETMRLLRHWLVDHILQEDLLIGDFLKARAAREAGADGKQNGAPAQPGREPPAPCEVQAQAVE